MDNNHKKFAIDCFNGTWELMDKTDRSEAENHLMLNMAGASCYHWSVCGTTLEIARGEWQLSRVCALLSLKECALYHGQYSLDPCLLYNYGGFDLAFGFEAVARAYGLQGEYAKAAEYKHIAKGACLQIADAEDHEYVLSQLLDIPG